MWAGNIPLPEPMLYNNASGHRKDTTTAPVPMSMPVPQHFQYDTPGYGHLTGYPIHPSEEGQSAYGTHQWQGADMVERNGNAFAQSQYHPSQLPHPGQSEGLHIPSQWSTPQQPYYPFVSPSTRPQREMPTLHPAMLSNGQTSSSVYQNVRGSEVRETKGKDVRSNAGHYNNLPKAVDELETFKTIFELFDDKLMEDLVRVCRKGHLGPQIKTTMDVLKATSSATVASARSLYQIYGILADMVIGKLRVLAGQSNRGGALLPDQDFDEHWKNIEDLTEATKKSTASLLQCTHDLKLLSGDAEKIYVRVNVGGRVGNWLASHAPLGRSAGAGLVGVTKEAGTQNFNDEKKSKAKRSDVLNLLNLELPATLRLVQISIADFNSHRVVQHEDLKSKMEHLKGNITPEGARRTLRDWEVFISSLAD